MTITMLMANTLKAADKRDYRAAMLCWLIPLFVSLSSLVFGYDEADLIFAGDAMQHQGQLDAARSGNNRYNYDQYFTAIEPIVSVADYAVVNLETPVSVPP